MYHTLYIDVFFLENLLTDYLLLSLTDRLLKLRSWILRRLAAAAAGSLCPLRTGLAEKHARKAAPAWSGRAMHGAGEPEMEQPASAAAEYFPAVSECFPAGRYLRLALEYLAFSGVPFFIFYAG